MAGGRKGGRKDVVKFVSSQQTASLTSIIKMLICLKNSFQSVVKFYLVV